MLLYEILSQPVPWKTEESSSQHVVASFPIGSIEYRVMMSYEPWTSNDINEITAKFPLSPQMDQKINKFFDEEGQYYWDTQFTTKQADNAGTDGYAPTGTGNQFLVFATMVDIIQQVTSHFNTPQVLFTAKEGTKLGSTYHSMVNKYFRNWDLFTFKTNHFSYFFLRK